MKPTDVIHITADEAVTALEAAAFKVLDPESADHGRQIVHCFLGSFGADWDLDGAVALARRADDIAWTWNIFGHELAILADGKVHHFDAKREAAKASGGAS